MEVIVGWFYFLHGHYYSKYSVNTLLAFCDHLSFSKLRCLTYFFEIQIFFSCLTFPLSLCEMPPSLIMDIKVGVPFSVELKAVQINAWTPLCSNELFSPYIQEHFYGKEKFIGARLGHSD